MLVMMMEELTFRDRPYIYISKYLSCVYERDPCEVLIAEAMLTVRYFRIAVDDPRIGISRVPHT